MLPASPVGLSAVSDGKHGGGCVVAFTGCLSSKGKFIPGLSAHIRSPQLATSASAENVGPDDPTFCDGAFIATPEYAAHQGTKFRVVERNDLPFMWPESEETEG
jgi:hypothetical protein